MNYFSRILVIFTGMVAFSLAADYTRAQERNFEASFTSTTGDVVQETPVHIDYEWPQDIPVNMSDSFYLEAEATVTAMGGDGIYHLRVTGTDQARVYLDGARVLDAWTAGSGRESFIELQAATGYQLYMESQHGTSTETALEWIKPGDTEWEPIPARDSDTSDWMDVELSWTAPTKRVNGDDFDPDSELEFFRLYRTECSTGDPLEFRGEVGPTFRSVTKQQAIPPGKCYEFYITGVDYDGLESGLSAPTFRENPATPASPMVPPEFTN